MANSRESSDSTTNPFFEDSHTLNHTESQENASRLMDDLELLRAERMASNEERMDRPRSKSVHRSRHNPEPPPEDAFDTLTAQPQIPQTKPDLKPTVVARIFKDIKKFPRVIRYFVYVCILPDNFGSFSANPPSLRAPCFILIPPPGITPTRPARNMLSV